MARTSGRSADPFDNDEITKKAKNAIGLLEKPSLPVATKADLIVLLEEVIKSRHLNQPEVIVESAQTIAATRIASVQLTRNSKSLKQLPTATNTAKVEELKAASVLQPFFLQYGGPRPYGTKSHKDAVFVAKNCRQEPPARLASYLVDCLPLFPK